MPWRVIEFSGENMNNCRYVYRTQSNICDGSFLRIWLTTKSLKLFSRNSFIIDARLCSTDQTTDYNSFVTFKSILTEAVVRRCSIEKVLFESQNSQENSCARAFFYKVAGLSPATLLKKRLWHRYFPMNFAKFLETSFL